MIAGLMAISTYIEVDQLCCLDLLRRVQFLSLWLDQRAAHRREEFEELIRARGQHLEGYRIIDAATPWRPCSGQLWREPLLRTLDDVRPEFVLFPDSDETFDDDFPGDFRAFCESGADQMMFRYIMPTDDGAKVPMYPKTPHVKAYRWRAGLAYVPYRGGARVTGLTSEYEGPSKIKHYCFYSAEMQARKCETIRADWREKMRERVPRPDAPFIRWHKLDFVALNRWQTLRGYLRTDEGKLLQQMAKGKRRVLEIGSFCGRSTICMAAVCHHLDAVDPHDGATMSRSGDQVPTLDYLRRNIRAAGFRNVTIHQARIEDIADTLPGEYGLIFIDGDHRYEAVARDLRIAERLGTLGCLIALHDYGGRKGGVTRAVDEWKGDRRLRHRAGSLVVFGPPRGVPISQYHLPANPSETARPFPPAAVLPS